MTFRPVTGCRPPSLVTGINYGGIEDGSELLLTVELLDGVLPILGIVDDVVIVLLRLVPGRQPVGRLVPVRPVRSLPLPVVILLQVS